MAFQFEYVEDLLPASKSDLYRLDGLLFDLDTHEEHGLQRKVVQEYRPSDYAVFDEEAYPPFEVCVWRHEVARMDGEIELNQGLGIHFIEDDEEVDYISTTDVTEPERHEKDMNAIRYKLDKWRELLPTAEIAWLDQFLDLAQDPDEAMLYAECLLDTTPYAEEIGVLSGLVRKFWTGSLSYRKVVGNEAYKAVNKDNDRGIGVTLNLECRATGEEPLIYQYAENGDGLRSLDIKRATPTSTEFMLTRTVLTAGKVYRFCNALGELLSLELGQPKIPRN